MNVPDIVVGGLLTVFIILVLGSIWSYKRGKKRK